LHEPVATGPCAVADPVNLLIVDDVPQNLVAMQALLQREGVNLLLAGSGAQALELLLEHEVALALLDVHMPEIDGFHPGRADARFAPQPRCADHLPDRLAG
jgi:CheY-like chemotaxis protein